MALLSLHTNVIKHVRGNTPLLVIAHKRYENARGNKPFLDIVFKRNEKTHEEINPYLSSQTSMQTTPSSWPLRVLTKVPVSMFQILMVPSYEEVAMPPEGITLMLEMSEEWPSSVNL